ncbi:MAG: AsmA family protein, partial [Desulfobacterales bacterium]
FEILGQPFPVQTTDPDVLKKVRLSAQIKGGTTQLNLTDGKLVLDDTQTNFTLAAKTFDRPDVTFDVNMDKLDLDRYRPAGDETAASTTAPAETAKTGGKDHQPDYEPLRRLIVDGRLTIGQLTAGKARLQNVRFEIAAKQGRFRIEPLAADLYGGAAKITGTFDVRQNQPRTDLAINLQNVAAGPMIKDLAQKEVIEGLLKSDIQLSFQGDDPDQIKQTLNGGGQLNFSDGALVGIDLAAMVRNVQAAFGQGTRVAEKPKTDFTEFRVPFTLQNGTFRTEAARLLSPLIRVEAQGQAELVAEQLDFRVAPKFVATIKGQGDTEDRSGVMVPVLVSGSFQKPQFAPDLEALVRQQVQKELIDSGKLDEVFEKNEELKPLEDAAKGLLKDVFK